jgi:hypothetical protein
MWQKNKTKHLMTREKKKEKDLGPIIPFKGYPG